MHTETLKCLKSLFVQRGLLNSIKKAKVEEHLLICITFAAEGLFYRVLRQPFQKSLSKIHRYICQVCHALRKLAAKRVKHVDVGQPENYCARRSYTRYFTHALPQYHGWHPYPSIDFREVPAFKLHKEEKAFAKCTRNSGQRDVDYVTWSRCVATPFH